MRSNHITSKNITAIVIGNALEWYDFVVYSFMTVVIAKLFFPATHAATSLLAATATFGVAFCLRPLGGILLGIYADRRGRKAAIMLVIGLMTVAILMICLVPTYAQIGILAPIIMVLARMLQGFSAGGEFGVSTSLLIELAPKNQRGFYGSWQMVGQMLAMFLGATIGIVLTETLTMAQLEAYGWRIPFIFGLLIAPVGLYMRSHLKETHRAAIKPNPKNHFWEEIRAHWRQIIISMGLVVGGTVATYVNISYLPTYATTYLGLDMSDAFTALGIAIMVTIILIPIFGSLSDRIGRRPILLSSSFIYLLIVYPLFSWLCHDPTLPKLMVVEMSCCMLLGAYFGVFAAAVAELFPMAIRSSGLGISYNLTVMIFGGFAQFIVTWLIEVLHSPIAIAYYLSAAIAISVIAAYFYEDDGV